MVDGTRRGDPARRADGHPGRLFPVCHPAVGGTAYVVNTIDGTVTPVDTRTGHAGRPLSVGLYSYPTAIAIAGSLAVVIDTYGGQVSLINLATRHVYPALTVGSYPSAVAITG